MENEDIEMDAIDIAVEELAKRFFGEEECDEDDLFVIMDFIEDLIDEEIIPDFPDEDSSEEEMKSWVDINIPVIESKLNEEIDKLEKETDGDSN